VSVGSAPPCITMTRRQNNNEWSGGIAAHPAQWCGGIAAHPASKKFECKIHWKSSRLDFLGSRRHSIEGHFEGETPRSGRVTNGVLFLRDNAPSHRALATQTKLAYLCFQCLDHTPYSPELAPSDYNLFPGPKKTIERSPFFVRRGGHCSCGDLVGRTIF